MARRKGVTNKKANVKKSTAITTTAASAKMTNSSIKDEPGGIVVANTADDDINESRANRAKINSILLNRGLNVEYLRKPSIAISRATESSCSVTQPPILVQAATTLAAAPITIANNNNNNNINNNTNDTNNSKYLHKKFKRIFCATLDSNITNSDSHHQLVQNHHQHHNNNNNNNNNNTNNHHHKAPSIQSSGPNLNNNSEIVANRNSNNTSTSWSNSSIVVSSQQQNQQQELVHTKSANNQKTVDPNGRNSSYLIQQSKVELPAGDSLRQPFATTEEEKQLVKDIIDINNENYQSVSAHGSPNSQVNNVNVPVNPNAASYLIANASSTSINAGIPYLTVTTLGNHNNNNIGGFVSHKVQGHQENTQFPLASNQQPNGSYLIINGQQPVEYPNQQQQQQQQQQQHIQQLQQQQQQQPTIVNSTPGRYICPYCQLNCAKPSVLQKHIRAHTNERPYPCELCGFAFKTKSNLYKHCRSRAHIQRCNGESDPVTTLTVNPPEEDGCSLESGDVDEQESNQLDVMNRLSSPSIVMESQINGNFGENSSSSSSNSSTMYPLNGQGQNSSSDNSTKPYKPKFHNYKKLDLSKAQAQVTPSAAPVTPSTPSTPSFFSNTPGVQLTPQIIEERISKIISDNEAIIDKVEALLQKKYHKITGMQRNLSVSSATSASMPMVTENPPAQSNSKLALALLKQQQQQKQHDEEIQKYHQQTQQPLNLTMMQEPLTVDVSMTGINQNSRKRCFNENVPSAPLVITSNNLNAQEMPEKVQYQPTTLVIAASHPQNPEGSIIKDLLLNSKNFGAIDGESGDGSYTCQTCKLSFRGADILKYHLICHCQGEENILTRSAPISPSGSSPCSSQYYPRSSSEKCSPNSLKNLASSTLKVGSSRTPSSLLKLAKSSLKIPKQKPENILINPAISTIKLGHPPLAVIKNPLPSPGPLLGNTRLVENRPNDDLVANKKPKIDYTAQNIANLSLYGGDMKVFSEKNVEKSQKYQSGGSFINLEPPRIPDSIKDTSPNLMRQGLSGGNIQEITMKRELMAGPPPVTPKLFVTITPTLAPTLTTQTMFFGQSSSTSTTLTTSNNKTSQQQQHFQFPPPCSPITIYNPLTLPLLSSSITSIAGSGSGPQSIVHGGRVIPYVQGMPGPNTMITLNKNDLPPPPVPMKDKSRMHSPSMKGLNGINALPPPLSPSQMMLSPKHEKIRNGFVVKKKSFNFARIGDNNLALATGSPRKKSPDMFNFDASEVSPNSEVSSVDSKPAFRRPTSLPLKPGTFTPKQHHGITPTANTLPLISPETPRPSKSCVQLYLNGHAYTYLGLKSSTKTFYCTVNKPQPVYIQNQHKLSMYSNWQIYNGNNPNILDLSPFAAMSLYDSRQRQQKFSFAELKKEELIQTVDSQAMRITTSIAPTSFQIQYSQDAAPLTPSNLNTENVANHNRMTPSNLSSGGVPTTLSGGFESTEEYTYVRGRGRGKYVCYECGIRCKKPSMLKKHIRTHTDLRPYTCSHCEFSFKTKGNLTKHMKSKAHFKKCTELGLNPIPTSLPDDDGCEFDDSASMISDKRYNERRSSLNGGVPDNDSRDSETDDGDESDDMDDDSDEDTDESKSRLPEHEAAHMLLSLSMTPTHAGNSSGQPAQPQPPFLHFASENSNTSSTHSSWRNQSPVPGSEASSRSRLLFSGTKSGDFDLLNHEQYYSDPNLNRVVVKTVPKEVPRIMATGDELMPMDLTKKAKPEGNVNHQRRPVMLHVNDVISKISEPALLLNHLVSNTDKIPNQHFIGNMNFTDKVQFSESFLPQAYITERALKDQKIKQSQQMAKTTEYQQVAVTPTTPLNEQFNFFSNYQSKPITEEEKSAPAVQAMTPIFVHKGFETAAPSSLMDTLADLASKSDKLEVKISPAAVVPKTVAAIPGSSIADVDGRSSTANAKSVASEYLKLTQQTQQRLVEEAADNSSDQEAPEQPALSNMTAVAQTVVVGEDGFRKKQQSNPSTDTLIYTHIQDDSGRSVCTVCSKAFQKAAHLRIHMNIHFMERKYRCEACAVSFRTQGHLQKHERSVSHQNKVSMTSTFGVPTVTNPRPFKCKDCKIAFRIHGHLAKHLRSKMHVLKLECLQKLPFGTYAEMERAGFNLTDIDTSDCDNSLASLRTLAKKLNEKDPTKLGPLPPLSADDNDAFDENYDSDSSDLGTSNGMMDGNFPEMSGKNPSGDEINDHGQRKRKSEESCSSAGDDNEGPKRLKETQSEIFTSGDNSGPTTAAQINTKED